MLYFRMAFTMGLGFFMTRELLAALGVVDYGLVNVIGGVVAMFAFLSGTMQTAASRFFNFELGRQDLVRLKQIFNLTQLIYIGLLVLMLLLAETVGLWFLQNKVVIPSERVTAAFWFFQFSTVGFLFSMASIPYRALIISHENMRAFAWISVGDAAGKLGIVYLLHLGHWDQLAFYGALLSGVAMVSFLAYSLTCRRLYSVSRFAFYWEKPLFKELLAFSGWNLWGAAAGLFTNVFINVLLNNYFGAAVAAARGVANQVSAGMNTFAQSFMTAVNPQIVKYYAEGNLEQAHQLVMRASRFGFYLFFLAALPLLLEMDFVLGIWLKEVPAHTILFARLMVVQVLIDTLSFPLMTLAQASGKIALYQSVVGGMMWMTLPIGWGALLVEGIPEVVAGAAIGVSMLCLGLRLVLVRRCSRLSIRTFGLRVVTPVVCTSSLALLLPLTLALSSMKEDWVHFALVGVVSLASSGLAIIFAGLVKEERNFLRQRLANDMKF